MNSNKGLIILGIVVVLAIAVLVWAQTGGKLSFGKNSSDASAIDWEENAPSQATFNPASLDSSIESHQHE